MITLQTKMDENAKNLRGSIDGKKKYCRIAVRRRRASRELAEQFVSDSLKTLEPESERSTLWRKLHSTKIKSSKT